MGLEVVLFLKVEFIGSYNFYMIFSKFQKWDVFFYNEDYLCFFVLINKMGAINVFNSEYRVFSRGKKRKEKIQRGRMGRKEEGLMNIDKIFSKLSFFIFVVLMVSEID